MCQGCGARFYDLRHDPIVCPKCGANFEPEPLTRGARKVPAKAVVPTPVPVARPADTVEVDDDLAEIDAEVVAEDADEDESGLIEDASDLGEDDDDVAEVMEHLDEEGEEAP